MDGGERSEKSEWEISCQSIDREGEEESEGWDIVECVKEI